MRTKCKQNHCTHIYEGRLNGTRSRGGQRDDGERIYKTRLVRNGGVHDNGKRQEELEVKIMLVLSTQGNLPRFAIFSIVTLVLWVPVRYRKGPLSQRSRVDWTGYKL